MEGQLIWCGIGVQCFGSDSPDGDTDCVLGMWLLYVREKDRSKPRLGRLEKTSISYISPIFPLEVVSEWGSIGGSNYIFPWQALADLTQADVHSPSSRYGSLPFPSHDSSAFFREGILNTFELESIVPISYWPQPSSSHLVNMLPLSFFPLEQTPSPPALESDMVAQFLDHFLVPLDISYSVEVVCHREEPLATRVFGEKYCGKNLGPMTTHRR